MIHTWDQFDAAMESGVPEQEIRDRLPISLDYDDLVQRYNARVFGEGMMIRASIGPADPTPPRPPPLQTGRPSKSMGDDLHAEFRKKFNDKAAQLCHCDIRDLMSSGHTKGCPEKK